MRNEAIKFNGIKDVGFTRMVRCRGVGCGGQATVHGGTALNEAEYRIGWIVWTG
jgi:hypothetical protein